MNGSSAVTICSGCGREFQASSDGKAMCPQCAGEYVSARPVQARPSPTKPSRLRMYMQSPTMILIALNTLVYLAMAFEGRSFITFDSKLLLDWGANSGALTAGGEWWRLLTCTFEHGGLLHIALNMWCLYSLGWLAELLFGKSRYTLLYLMCGIGGSLGSICWRGNGLSVGASGAIFGIAGALIPAMMLHGNPQLRAALKGHLSSIGLFVFYNLAFGAAVHGIDNAAHVGGLITGLALGFAFPTGLDRNQRRGQMRVVAGMLVMLMAFGGAAAYARRHNQGYIESDYASAAFERGDVNGAIAHAQRAVALQPDDAHTQFMLGALLLDRHRDAEAVAPFASTTRLRPDFGPAFVNLCAAQLGLNRTQEALANCEHGAQLAPNDAESWFNLGRARYAMHNTTGARDALAKAVSLNPQGFDENLQYGLMLIANGENAKAVLYLQKAHNLHPQDEDVTRLVLQAQGQ